MSAFDPNTATPIGGFDPSSAQPIDPVADAKKILNLAVKQNPDQAAKASRLAQDTGLDFGAVLRNMDKVDASKRADDAAKATVDAPTLNRYVQDFRFASQFHDEMPEMGFLERTVRGFAAGTPGAAAPTLQGHAELFDITKRRVLQAIAGVVLPKPQAGGEATIESIAGPSLAEEIAPAVKQLKAAETRVRGMAPEQMTFYDQVLSGLGQLPGQIASSVLTGGYSTFAQGVGIMSDKIKNDPNKNLDDRDAALLLGGAVTAVTEKVTEKLIPRGLFDGKVMEKGLAAAATRVGVAGLTEGGQEVSENLLQDVIRKSIVNPDASIDVVQSLEEGGVGAVVGAVARGVVEGALRVRTRTQRAEDATEGTRRLQELFSLASQLKTRERDPQVLGDFIQQAAEESGTAPTELFMDGRALVEVLQQSGTTMQQIEALLPSVAPQLQEAAATGNTVAIPIGELTASIPGTALEPVFLQNLRTTPDGLSQVEAEEVTKQAEQLLQTESDRVIREAEDAQAVQASSDVVFETVLSKLNAAARFRPEVNQSYAKLQTAFFTSMAARFGMTPEQLYAKYEGQVLAESLVPDVQPAGVYRASTAPKLGQLDNLEVYHFSMAPRSSINTSAFGTGLKGSNRERFMNATDKRLRNRAYFYVDKGTGINPEDGVGGVAHRANLSNIYDANSDPLRLRKGSQEAFEAAVLDAGFSGYLDRMAGTASGQVILLGNQSVTPELLGPGKVTSSTIVGAPKPRESRGRDIVVDALRARTDLPAGSMKPEMWSNVLASRMPETHAALQAAGIFEGKEALYKSELIAAYEAATPAPSYAQSGVRNVTLEEIVPAEILARVQTALEGYVKGGSTDPLTPEQRSEAEALLAPYRARAEANKAAFDQGVREVAASLGGTAKLAGVKGMKRAAEKLVLDSVEGDLNPADIKDFLRATVVVSRLEDIDRAIAALQSRFNVLRVKNRFETPLATGYRDVLMNVATPDGAVAEVQISVPAMLTAKDTGHKLYEMQRALPEAAPEAKVLETLQKELYGAAFDYASGAGSAANLASSSAISSGLAGTAFSANSAAGTGLPPLAPTTLPSASLNTGAPSISNNSAPGGTTSSSISSSSYAPIVAGSETYSQSNRTASKPGPDAPGVGVEQENKLGFWPALRVKLTGKLELPKKAPILAGTTNKNAAKQIGAIDEILAKFPKAAESSSEWSKMMAYALGSDEVPIPPYAFIRDLNGNGSLEKLRTLTQGQIDDATHGFENAAEFRRAYVAGELGVETTGKLFMWSFLSRGVSPYTQEALFIDAFEGADRWIAMAARGEFTEAVFPEYEAWAKSVAPQGSGQPGAGATHNLNAFGQDFLFKMSRVGADGKTHMQRLHDMMADPNQTGKQIRREFATFGEGVGIDNKVVSFTLLVAGFPDVMVLDRVQIRQLWDDGRFNGVNLYDGVTENKMVPGKDGTSKMKPVKLAGSSLNSLAEGARGILVYEAIERGLEAKIQQLYTDLGRPQDASIGRYHWETWVADSQQEASHGTLGAILADAKGDDQAIANVSAKQGEYGAYEYGALYNRDADGTPWFGYQTPSGAQYAFSVPAFRAFLTEIKKAGAGVVPSGFLVTNKRKSKDGKVTEIDPGFSNGPWYNRPGVDTGKLDERASFWADRAGGSGEGQRAIEEALQQQAPNDTGSGAAGAGGLNGQAGNGSGRDSGRSIAPLAGAPSIVGATGPDPKLVDLAEQYARSIGIDLKRQGAYVKVDPDRAARIAAAYEAMPHAPQDPAVKEAFQNLIDQTMAQYRVLEAAGYKFFLVDETNDPYAGNPWNAMRDLRANQTMGVFATEAGFGSGATELNVDDNPLLADTGVRWPYGSLDGEPKRVLANDLFRAVHDAFGHGLEGAGFRADGEENAWQAHVRLFTGSAVGAITSETRGQNSWLNYGPYGEQNRNARVEDTVFADQKTGLMPEWTWMEGRALDADDAILNAQDRLATGDITQAEFNILTRESTPDANGAVLNQTPRSRKDLSFKDVVKRTPELQAAAEQVKNGEMTAEEYDALVNEYKPVEPYESVPDPATPQEMADALTSDKVARIGVPAQTLEAGHPVGLRLDIPAYSNHGTWVVSVHEQEAGFNAGKSIGYESAAMASNVSFGVVEKAAVNIASGKPKATIAVIKGGWVPTTPEQAKAEADAALSDPSWAQAGMDPERHAYFYDRSSMEPIVAGERVIQLGPLVLVKNPVYGNKADFLFQTPEGAQAQEAEQAQAPAPLGTFNPQSMDITLLKDANLSTFLHESGHYFLEVMADLAANPDAPPQVQADMGIILGWFGVKDLATWRSMSLADKRDYHERWAESFEQYLFEGKAPSIELRGTFAAFTGFLKQVYSSLTKFLAGRGLRLSDDVRGVMDRMLASDTQIAQAQELANFEAVYKSAEEAGMSVEEWTKYQTANAEATNEAMAAMQARGLRDMQWMRNARGRVLRKLQDEVEQKRKAMREEVEAEVNEMPLVKARNFIEDLTAPTDEDREASKAWRDSRKQAEALAREETKTEIMARPEAQGLTGLKKGQYLAKTKREVEIEVDRKMLEWDRANPQPRRKPAEFELQAVAEMFGFPSGEDLERALFDTEPTAQLIDALTDQRLLETYGDLVTPSGIQRAADEAIYNEARTRFLATELATMQRSMGATEPSGTTDKRGRPLNVNVMVKAAKGFAEALVARRKVRDIKPGLHTAAAARAAKRATEAQAGGDTEAGIAAKRDQLLNAYAARMSYKAQDEIKRSLDYLKKFNKEGTRKNLPTDYLEQIDKLLERIDLRQVTNRDLDRRASLLEWVESQRELGIEPLVPAELLAEAQLTSYRDMTLQQFREVVDAVKNIEHLGRLKDRLLKAKDKREFAAIVEELAASIRDNAVVSREERVEAPTQLERAVDTARDFFSSHRKLSSIVRQLDGFKDNGPFWRVFVRSMNEAGDQEAVMRADATESLSALFTPFLKNNKMTDKVFVPELGRSLSLETRLAVALNWGNDQNRQRILDGDKWSIVQGNGILSTLTAEQLNFVQDVWDLVDGYWSEIKAKEERVSGVAPDKVQPSAFEVTLADGTTKQMRGGYYPIKYDPDRSSKAESNELAELTKQMMQGAFTRATTRRGHTQARAEKVNRPVRKDINVVFEHIGQVTHDLAWHEWLIDATRLLRAGGVDSAIRETMGPETLRELKKAVTDIALGETPAQSGFERGINHLRQGVTVVGMGWNLMTSLMQPLGLSQSIVRIGPKWVGKGLARWVGDAARMESTVNEVYAKSDFMRLRGQTMNREINEIRNKVNGSKLSALEETYFYLIQKGQLIADLPTWLGQYEKSMATGVDDATAVAAADQAVRDSQGGGQVADLARIQRGGPLQKLFTNFYSYFNTTYNLNVERYRDTNFKSPAEVGRFAVDMLMLNTVPVVLAVLMKEALVGSGEDDEDKLVKKLAAEQLNYLLGTMVGLREVGAAITGFNGYTGPAGTRFFSEIGKLAKQAEQGELDKALLKSLNNAAGMLFHYPAGQVNRTVEGWMAVQEGKAGPEALVVGPPKP